MLIVMELKVQVTRQCYLREYTSNGALSQLVLEVGSTLVQASRALGDQRSKTSQSEDSLKRTLRSEKSAGPAAE